MLSFKSFITEEAEKEFEIGYSHNKSGKMTHGSVMAKNAKHAIEKCKSVVPTTHTLHDVFDTTNGHYHHPVTGRKMKDQFQEDAGAAGAVASGPTNTAGGGQVAGMGQPPGSKSGEPGVYLKKKKKAHNPVMMGMGSRKPPKI